MCNVSEMFGQMVFNDSVMQQRLPANTYDALQKAIREGKLIDSAIAGDVASVMKEWAIEKGATHYTHWFQPMTGITAEKHDSFITPTSDGHVIMEFSKSALVKGESDASSFPSGGLRATFEARGYTAWDPTSYAFVKGNTLYIPTAFCSYGGEALDEKTPLLRSMQAISAQAVRVLRLFGHEDVKAVKPTAGAEQEYFLVDRAVFEKRKDLAYTGRTLFGAQSPKGQELDDQYFGAIKPRVSAFMKSLDEALWRLGVPAKTEHNEAAPAQHELALVFSTANIATDHNQLTMEIMQSIAREHDMVCLLHEKPFAGINGSGKHNNWSLETDTGMNLFDPGSKAHKNKQFLLFLTAVIKAVDDYQDLLRISVASAGNDHRLGAAEAPPAILSMFLGDELCGILDAIENNTDYDAKKKAKMEIGVSVMPDFTKDTTDRNRTSPFAFTGNKFEFRMPGSAMSIAEANTVINTAVAEAFRQIADELEGAEDLDTAMLELMRKIIKKHKRIIFNGNGYDDAWTREAEKRGLLNLPTVPDALPHFLNWKNIELFKTHGVFSEAEINSRYEIKLENYCKLINIEAVTMYKIAKKDILHAASACTCSLSAAAMTKKSFLPDVDCSYEEDTVRRLTELETALYRKVNELYTSLCDAEEEKEVLQKAFIFKDSVLEEMREMRVIADEMESIMSRKFWPFPTYGDMLFSVR